jgi:hypothetical protein
VFYESNNAIWMHDTVRGVTSRVRQGAGEWVAWGPGPNDYTFHEHHRWGVPGGLGDHRRQQ